jgi:hypothetical protein
MTLAGSLGKYTGIIIAESLWIAEMGVKTGATYYISKFSMKVTNVSMERVSKIATQHAIDFHNPEKVTENVFNCLQFMD